MVETITSDVRTLLDRTPFDASAVADIREALGRDPSRYRTLREAVQAMSDRAKSGQAGDSHLRMGVAEILMGRNAAGLENLGKAGDSAMVQHFRGRALMNVQKYEEAAEAFETAAKGGYDAKNSELLRVGALRLAGKAEEARKILDGLTSTAGNHAEFHYQMGCFVAVEGDLKKAAEEFEKALAADREHTGALFELAYINDLYGNDDVAIEYYKQCTRKPPVPLAALINLGILYEDEMKFRDAEACYRQVLQFDPNQPRARLFFRDCLASRDMYYNPEDDKYHDRLRTLLEIPVTDFELSVRSRNCLKKMNIRTLGDLTRTTEATLLASKNFGETSLSEIKEMMTAKGLRLGMALEAAERGHAPGMRMPEPQVELSQEERAQLAKPITDLNLSVRARKCMTKLAIQSVGELISRSGDELLECKNFGVTSLNEVRERLNEMGLKLKGE
ncbi:MAG: DNA-directed RNA polymerase subunit alpha C-terminal domain-containing protein [Isosphaeraceae bacterium]